MRSGMAPKWWPEYYISTREKYQDYISGNELLTIQSAWEEISKKAIYLLTLLKLVGVNRERIVRAIRGLDIAVKVLSRKSNAIWDILLTPEEEVKKLAGCIFTKSVRMQSEYMGGRRT